MNKIQVQEMLGVGKARFFALMKSYRQDPDSFSIAYERSMPARLSAEVEAEIEKALLEKKEIVQDPDLSISSYNYTALRDRLRNKGVDVSVTTILCACLFIGQRTTRLYSCLSLAFQDFIIYWRQSTFIIKIDLCILASS